MWIKMTRSQSANALLILAMQQEKKMIGALQKEHQKCLTYAAKAVRDPVNNVMPANIH